MKQKQKGRKKTQYFRKDYAPAKYLAMQKKADKPTTKAAESIKLTAQKIGHSTAKLAKTASAKIAKAKQTRSKRSASAKPQARRNVRTRSSTKRVAMTWREKTLLSLIATSAAMIAVTFAFSVLYDPIKRSERELEKLADAYYIEYLYPSVLGKSLNQPETILADYVSAGMPSVRLRQLLLYNDSKYSDSASIFSNSYYHCDTNKTYIRYFPVAPYGPRDYTVKYGTACERVSQNS